MCGLIGILSSSSSKYIDAANAMIAHRGPDDNGFYQEGNLALGHRRLSIIDLSANGHQPMFSNDQSIVMVYNGEIYNHLDIREKIGPHQYKSSSDSETIIVGYQKWGVEIFNMLNGIFALSIYDKRTNEMILARDHFGTKPLYYYQDKETIIWGSEIKSFLPIPHWDRSLDYSAFVNYLHFLYSPGEQTPFKNIKKLLPGHYAKVSIANPSSFTNKKYYDIPFNGTYEEASEESLIEELDEVFTNAVKRQLLSDVPVGFFLSGGLDSSIIVAKARDITNRKIQCYTIDTDLNEGDQEGFTNDLYFAKKVAEHLDVELEIVKADFDIVRDFDKMIWHLDEPQADAAPLNMLNICRAARQKGNVVLLGGTGGDDLFSGYRRHQALAYEKYINIIPASIANLAQRIFSNFSMQNATMRKINKLLKHAHLDQTRRLAGYFEWLPLKKNKELFSDEIMESIWQYNPADILIDSLSNIPKEKSPLNKLLYWDMKYFLCDHNLNYSDKMSMAVGVEARVPFLDVDLVNFSTKIPIKLKLKGTTTKYLLKKVAEKYLPHEVIYRPKTGFGAPVRRWITKDMDGMIQDYLSVENINKRGIFNSKKVWNLIEDNKSGKIDASYSIWCLLSIESWMKQFVDPYSK